MTATYLEKNKYKLTKFGMSLVYTFENNRLAMALTFWVSMNDRSLYLSNSYADLFKMMSHLIRIGTLFGMFITITFQ